MNKLIHNVIMLCFLSLTFITTTRAQEKDWIEQNYPYLKKVHANTSFPKESKVVFIASDQGSYYVIKNDLKNPSKTTCLLPQTELNEKHKFFDIEAHLFTFGTYNTYVYLKGVTPKRHFGCHKRRNNELYYTTSSLDYPYRHFKIYQDTVSDRKVIMDGYNDLYFLGLNPDSEHFGIYDFLGNNPKIASIYLYDDSVPSIGEISISTEEGYGTYYTESSYVLPQGLTGYTITEAYTETKDLKLNPSYQGGDIVPAQTALLVKGEKGKYPVYAATDKAAKSNRAVTTMDNLLRGTATMTWTTAPDNSNSYSFYKLYYLKEVESGPQRLGFFWGAEGGSPFINGANKAYLALPQATGSNIRGFVLPQDDITGIQSISTNTDPKKAGIYTINGLKLPETPLKELPSGFYIINGEKIRIK